jgi:hypothetical protein
LKASPVGQFVCNLEHPRCQEVDQEKYKYHQFGMQHVGQFSGVSEFLKNGPPIIHHQTWLAELISARPDTNAVASWSDAMSIVNGGRVWGGFISARSDFKQQSGMDSQLIGLEIDVLNAGKPGLFPNSSKVGLQIVGFGRENTNAIEVLSQGPESGQWQNILQVAPGTVSKNGTIIGVGPQKTQIGINLFGSSFSDSALILSTNSKITFRSPGLSDAALYRDEFSNGFVVLQLGPAGLRITNTQNNKNLVIITPDGDIITPRGKLSDLYDRIEKLEAKLNAK